MGDGPTGEFSRVDRNVATNLREWREAQGLSQGELAQRMSERGFGFSQATIWKIEQGKRPVKVSEAVALAEAVGLRSWNSLTADPATTRHDARVQAAHFRAGQAYQALKAAAAAYLQAQYEVAVTAHEARESGVNVAELWTNWLGVPGERAVIESRIEDAQEDAVRDQLGAAVEQVMQALRDRGFEAIIDLDEVKTIPAGDAATSSPRHP
jgi:transcriptional regulator with XRE-family HTH domain